MYNEKCIMYNWGFIRIFYARIKSYSKQELSLFSQNYSLVSWIAKYKKRVYYFKSIVQKRDFYWSKCRRSNWLIFKSRFFCKNVNSLQRSTRIKLLAQITQRYIEYFNRRIWKNSCSMRRDTQNPHGNIEDFQGSLTFLHYSLFIINF